MKPGDLVRINWTDAECELYIVRELYIVLEVIDLEETESKYLEPGDRAVRFLDSGGSVHETIYSENEVRSGFFEILSLSPIRPS
jgi:hypothetical protein